MFDKDIEYIVHCDEEGMPIGPISKHHAHMPWVRENICHYSTRAMVYNYVTDKWWFQKKRAKKYSEEKWDMWVAWHNSFQFSSEGLTFDSFEETLLRECFEEIWLEPTLIDDFSEMTAWSLQWTFWMIFDHQHLKTEDNNEYVGKWIILTSETEVTFEDWEVIDFAWVSDEDVESFLEWKVYSEALTQALGSARELYSQSQWFQKYKNTVTDDFEDRLFAYRMKDFEGNDEGAVSYEEFMRLYESDNKQTCYAWNYITVSEEDIDGHTYERVSLRPGVQVYAFNGAWELLLIKEFRTHEWAARWKFVSGWCDKEWLESIDIAKEELLEEVSMTADIWECLYEHDSKDMTVYNPKSHWIATWLHELTGSDRIENPDTFTVEEKKFVSLDEFQRMIDKDELIWNEEVLVALQAFKKVK